MPLSPTLPSRSRVGHGLGASQLFSPTQKIGALDRGEKQARKDEVDKCVID